MTPGKGLRWALYVLVAGALGAGAMAYASAQAARSVQEVKR